MKSRRPPRPALAFCAGKGKRAGRRRGGRRAVGSDRAAVPFYRMLLVLCLLFSVVIFPALSWGAPEIAVSDPFPLRGEPVTVTLENEGAGIAGAEIQATYRPQSDVELQEVIGKTDAVGAITWTPRAAGLVTLGGAWAAESGETASASNTLSVRFGGVPPQGVAMMIIAALILFGGAGYSIARLMRPG